MANSELFAGDINAAGWIEIGREDAEIQVGHERAEEQDTVAAFDVLRDLRAAHRTFVKPDEQRMFLRNDAFTKNGRRDRDFVFFGPRDHFVLQAEAVDL